MQTLALLFTILAEVFGPKSHNLVDVNEISDLIDFL
jgi:hypothetical protein